MSTCDCTITDYCGAALPGSDVLRCNRPAGHDGEHSECLFLPGGGRAHRARSGAAGSHAWSRTPGSWITAYRSAMTTTRWTRRSSAPSTTETWA